MNKKGFVLMETIVVIVVVSVAMLTLFSSYNKILNRIMSENRYDTPEYLYMVNYIRDELWKKSGVSSYIFDFNGTTDNTYKPIDILNDTSVFNSNEQTKLKQVFNAKSIYIVTNVGNGNNFLLNLQKFDPYTIEYIKKLDVTTFDVLIIVSFDRDEVEESTKNIYCESTYSTNKYCSSTNVDNLKKTFISSLRW